MFFFSFFKLTSYPFFLLSPLQSHSVVFLFYLFYFIRPHPFIYVFSFFFVFVFVLYFMSLSTCVVSDVYRSLCTCESVNYMSCHCLPFLFLYSVFFLFMGAVKIGLKRMIKHVPSFSNACVYL